MGKKELGSFDNFQNIKYNNGEKWDEIKKQYKLKNHNTNGKMKKNKNFVAATTIQEANDYAKNVLGIENVSYEGVDITTANAWNEGLKDTFDRFPELKQNFGFVGECHERNKSMEIVSREYYLNKLSLKFPKMDKKNLAIIAEEQAKKEMKKYNIENGTLAKSFSPNSESYLYHFRGVTVNKNYGKDSNKFAEILKESVDYKFHPIGCDTIRSVLDHEVGHQLDVMLAISEQENIKNLFDSMDKETITNGLSEYAWNNKNKKRYAEFIAEGWAEYCNNPNPRKIAKEIGQTIERRYAEWTKKNS